MSRSGGFDFAKDGFGLDFEVVGSDAAAGRRLAAVQRDAASGLGLGLDVDQTREGRDGDGQRRSAAAGAFVKFGRRRTAERIRRRTLKSAIF